MVHVQDHPISLVDENTVKHGMAKSFYGQHGYAMLQKAQEYGDVLKRIEKIFAFFFL